LITTAPQDKYCEYLEARGHKVELVPVIQFRFINKQKLHESLENKDDYDGIIFTSSRSVQAVAEIRGSEKCLEDKDIFVVGETTEKIVKEKLGLDSFGSSTGSGDALADFIIHHYSLNKKSFLFPVSSIAKDNISSQLENNGHKINRIDCYETIENEKLKEHIKNLQEENDCSNTKIFVFFSPSGVDHAFRYIKASHKTRKHVSIGETTRQALLNKNIEDVLCAKRPTPQSLCDLIDNLRI